MAGEVDTLASVDLSKIDNMPVTLEDHSFEGIRSAPELIQYLKDIRDLSVDYVVPGPKLNIEASPDGKEWKLAFTLSKMDVDAENVEHADQVIVVKPTGWAQSQMIGKTPVPKRYHDEMLASGRGNLAAINLNTWLHDLKNKVMIRTVGDQFRAVVSDRYKPIDNLDLFGQVARTIQVVNHARAADSTQPLTFWKADVTDTDLFLSIHDKASVYNLGTPDKPDIYNTMTVVRNSEVGKSSMSVEPGFFRGMCMNIYTRAPALRKVHTGSKLDEGVFSFSDDTHQAAKELWQKEVRDVLNATIVNHSFFDDWAKDFKESKEVQIPDMQVAVHRVAEEYKFTDAEADAIMSALMTDQTIYAEDRGTAYALLQGMTAASKGFGVEKVHEVARIAGDVKKVMAVVA
jgi:hypothetical protein